MIEAYRIERQNEFITLKHGAMILIVREYVNKFEELYKFAAEIFPTEAQKCYRFKKGLQTVLKSELLLYYCEHFRGWIEKAIEKKN